MPIYFRIYLLEMFSIDMETLNDKIEQLLDPIFARTMLFKLGMILLVIAGLNSFLLNLFKIDLIDGIFGDGPVSKVIYFFIGVSALTVMFDRDTYLPFLGQMVAPCSVLQDTTPSGATKNVTVKVAPGAKVLFWAAEPSNNKFKKLNNWKDAYLNFDNAGVSTADENGNAVLSVREPQQYTVILKGKLDTHIHYRVCGKAGWMGRVQTVKIGEQKVEGFLPKITKAVYDKKSKLDIGDYSASIY
jgi:uncharacterized membrane protein YuzA (DUF378 family)